MKAVICLTPADNADTVADNCSDYAGFARHIPARATVWLLLCVLTPDEISPNQVGEWRYVALAAFWETPDAV